MAATNTYTKTAVRLHWLIAVLIIALLAGGFLMGFIPEKNYSLRGLVINWHKTIGLAILALSLFRLYWRLTHKPPALPPKITGLPKLLSKAVHIFFYAFIIVMPLIGLAAASVAQYPIMLFNKFSFPKLPFWKGAEKPQKEQLYELFIEVHEVLAFAAIALIVLHVAAAIKHHMSGDDILARMLPSLAKNKKE